MGLKPTATDGESFALNSLKSNATMLDSYYTSIPTVSGIFPVVPAGIERVHQRVPASGHLLNISFKGLTGYQNQVPGNIL